MKRGKKKITKKQKLNLEKTIFTVVLGTIGFVVVCLFSITIFQGPGIVGVGTSLQTQIAQGGSVGSSGGGGAAESLLVVGALAFCILGFVIYVGLKIHDRFF